MSKLERIRAWYDSGGRLKLPLDLLFESEGGVYWATILFRRISDPLERDGWEWLAGVMMGLIGAKGQIISVDGWYGRFMAEARGIKRGSPYVVIIEIEDSREAKEWEKHFEVRIKLPYGDMDGHYVKYESVEEVNFARTAFEDVKRKLERELNQLLYKLLEKVEKWRDEYSAGWRLRFSLEFIIYADKERYRVAGIGKEMPETVYEICSWLASNMVRNDVDISVKVGEFIAMAYWIWEINKEQYRLRLDFTFGHYGSIIQDVDTFRWSLRSRDILFGDIESSRVAVVMFEHVKREIEERLNGLLEKVLFE
jgi:hypothetical protein